jgi:hypothetical protein
MDILEHCGGRHGVSAGGGSVRNVVRLINPTVALACDGTEWTRPVSI